MREKTFNILPIVRNTITKNLVVITILLFIYLICFPLVTSTMNIDAPGNSAFSFINFNSNRIKCLSDSSSMESLSNLAFRVRNGEEKISIVHIGDSHIQADIFTGEVRKLLSAYFNEASISKGFCFPFSVIGSNNSEDLKCKSTGIWISNRIKTSEPVSETGISGVSIETIDSSASIDFHLKETEFDEGCFDKIKVYFKNDSLSYQPIVDENYQSETTDKNSITYRLINPVNTISVKLKKDNNTQKRFLFYGVELLNSKSTLNYHAVGVNGADVKSYLTSNKFCEQLKSLNPSIAIISLGTNDSYNPSFNSEEFKNSYSTFIDRIKKEIPDAIIILTTPGDHLLPKRRVNPNIQLACTQIERVAIEKDCLIWDFNGVMGGTGSIKSWAKLGLSAPDHLHLSKQGYRLQGFLFYDALIDLFENN